jgi:hypothetical protein
MTNLNLNVGYGAAQVANAPYTTGKVFLVAGSSDVNFNDIDGLYRPDVDGQERRFATISAALSACVEGRGDVVLLSPNFTTAPTLAELATAHEKGVMMEQAGGKMGDAFVTLRETGTLPATTAAPIFTVTGMVRLLDIVGEVTTAIQNQANNTKLTANPTVGAGVDLCSVASTANDAIGTTYTITGTLATALQKNANGVLVAQAAPVLVPAGSIDLSCAATNTGSVKWMVRYQPVYPGARVFAA